MKDKYIKISDYPQSWSILESGNREFMIRINFGYKEAVGHPEFPVKLGIAVPVKEHNDKTTELKYSIEDFLVDFFAADKGVLTAVITGLGEAKFIEFLSYTNTSIDFKSLHETLQKKYQNFSIQMNAKEESDWATYKSFI